ncbi:DUF397 domain-containing protein [Streptomyces sp. NRRL WC-3549]|uniref:DUF397 domain-containing protein n=1 Tax=Streptomyces sp. NRRL WC-3549 TaxID=1463925 RepID=UPI0004C5F77A|nr:DUF397 domain-containing protein [Streptomyces sp. NRRL WC-3549]
MNTVVPVPPADDLTWCKSSYSAGNGGDCVEVATTYASVYVRDSKRAEGPVLDVGPAQWAAFVRMAARG